MVFSVSNKSFCQFRATANNTKTHTTFHKEKQNFKVTNSAYMFTKDVHYKKVHPLLNSVSFQKEFPYCQMEADTLGWGGGAGGGAWAALDQSGAHVCPLNYCSRRFQLG